MTIRFFTFAAFCVGAMQLLADDPGRELWSSPWTEVTPRNGVWDEYYRRTDDPANCSFRFRVMRHAAAIGVEAFVRDDKVVVDDCPTNSISCETWKDDCLEVFFDGDGDRNPNTRGPQYETNPTPCNAGGEYAIAANGSTQSDYASAKKCFGTLWGGTVELWKEGGKRVGTHYRLWFTYACLNRPTPRLDEPVSFGFTICVHDDDDGGANDLALYWKGNPKIPYADESAFGTILLPPVAHGVLEAGRNVLFNSDYSVDDGIGTPLGWERIDFKEDAFDLHRIAGGGIHLDFDARSNAGVILEQRNLSLQTGAVYRVRGEMRSDCPPKTKLRFFLHGSPWQTTAWSDNLMTSTTGRWVRLDMPMTMPAVKNARKCAFGFNACNGKGSVEVRNLSLEPEDPSVAVVPYGRGLNLSPLPARIVPVDPLLSRLDADAGRLRCYWAGSPTGGVESCQLRGAIDGRAASSASFTLDGYAELSFGGIRPGNHKIALQVIDRSGQVLASNDYAVVAVRAEKPVTVGRHLNNFVIELVNAPLKDGDYVFSRPVRGWIWISFDGACGEAKGYLDKLGMPVVRRREGEIRLETQRFVEAGRHVLHVKGATGGRLRIHQIKTISTGSVEGLENRPVRIRNRFHFFLPFATRFGLVSTFNTIIRKWATRLENHYLPEYQEIGFYLERGMKIQGPCGFEPEDPDRFDADATFRRMCNGSWKFGLPMTVDENKLRWADRASVNFSEAVWRMSELKPQCPVSVYYADSSDGVWYRNPRVNVSEISSVINSGGGTGLLCPELYMPVQRTQASFDAYIDAYARFLESSVRMVPAADGATLLWMATYVQLGSYSNYSIPEVDIKKHDAAMLHIFATDPRFAACAGIGYGGNTSGEEEIRRWGVRCIRYYALEGGTEDLAEKYGFTWRPGLVKNCDFAEGLKGWKAEPATTGSLRTERIARYGKYFQNRRGMTPGYGDDVLTFRSSAVGPSRVSQRIRGLKRGRYYALLYCVTDRESLFARCDPARPAFLTARLKGAIEVEPLHFSCAALRPHRLPKSPKQAIVRTIRSVFRAEGPEATLIFEDRDRSGKAPPDGFEQVLNYIVLRPYYSEGPEEIPDIVKAFSGKDWTKNE